MIDEIKPPPAQRAPSVFGRKPAKNLLEVKVLISPDCEFSLAAIPVSVKDDGLIFCDIQGSIRFKMGLNRNLFPEESLGELAAQGE